MEIASCKSSYHAKWTSAVKKRYLTPFLLLLTPFLPALEGWLEQYRQAIDAPEQPIGPTGSYGP